MSQCLIPKTSSRRPPSQQGRDHLHPIVHASIRQATHPDGQRRQGGRAPVHPELPDDRARG